MTKLPIILFTRIRNRLYRNTFKHRIDNHPTLPPSQLNPTLPDSGVQISLSLTPLPSVILTPLSPRMIARSNSEDTAGDESDAAGGGGGGGGGGCGGSGGGGGGGDGGGGDGGGDKHHNQGARRGSRFAGEHLSTRMYRKRRPGRPDTPDTSLGIGH